MSVAAAEIESEDDSDDGASTRSTSYAGPSRLTQRQAALKGLAESAEHVSLGEYSLFKLADVAGNNLFPAPRDRGTGVKEEETP